MAPTKQEQKQFAVVEAVTDLLTAFIVDHLAQDCQGSDIKILAYKLLIQAEILDDPTMM